MANRQGIRVPTEPAFFEPEIREGFYISRMMKRLWAAQLGVLSAIDDVCEKLGIKWYADNGTLLGAVRHGGYIPWDDDLDISMFRADYRRFLAVAESELPKGYVVRNIHTDPTCNDLTTRILNSGSIRLDSEFLTANAGFPYAAGVDIFPLDDLAIDEEAERDRCRRIKEVSRLGELLLKEPEGNDTLVLFEKVQRENGVSLEEGKLSSQLNIILEKLYAMYTGSGSPYIALMHYWSDRLDHRYERRMFTPRLCLPFENTRLYVPGMYSEVLHVEYGDYMRVVKGGNLHTWPIYAPQEEQLANAFGGKNPLIFDFQGAISSSGVKMPKVHGVDSDAVEEKIITDPLLGFDPYGGYRATMDPATFKEDKEVILQPALIPSLDDEWNEKLAIAMEEQIFSPMMIYADRVRLPNEELRTFFLERLKQATPQIAWENKIEITKCSSGSEVAQPVKSGGPKTILFYTGYSSMLAGGDKVIEKIRKSLSVMLDHAGGIQVLWLPQILLAQEEDNRQAISQVKPELFTKWASLLTEFEVLLTVDMEEAISRADAFYGDAGYVAHLCRLGGKPVMIWTISDENVH